MKVLITAANGGLAQKCAELLSDAGHELRLSARNPTEGQTLLAYDQPDSFAAAVEGIDAMVLFSFPAEPDLLTQLSGLIDAAITAGLKHVVNISAMPTAWQPDSPRAKVEQYILDANIDGTILRPNWFMQNFTGWLAPGLKKGVLMLPAGQGATSFIDSADIAACVAHCIVQEATGTFTLTGREAFTYEQVCALIGESRGDPVKYVSPSAARAKKAMSAMGGSEQWAEYFVSLYGDVAAGKFSDISEDLQKLLNRPPGSLEAFIAQNSQFWR